MTPISQGLDNATTVVDDLTLWIRAPQVNVLYKAFALVAILVVLAMIPQTSRFASWAAWIVLVLLLIQGN